MDFESFVLKVGIAVLYIYINDYIVSSIVSMFKYITSFQVNQCHNYNQLVVKWSNTYAVIGSTEVCQIPFLWNNIIIITNGSIIQQKVISEF